MGFNHFSWFHEINLFCEFDSTVGGSCASPVNCSSSWQQKRSFRHLFFYLSWVFAGLLHCINRIEGIQQIWRLSWFAAFRRRFVASSLSFALSKLWMSARITAALLHHASAAVWIKHSMLLVQVASDPFPSSPPAGGGWFLLKRQSRTLTKRLFPSLSFRADHACCSIYILRHLCIH